MCMRWLVALLLLAASILKAYQLIFDSLTIGLSTEDLFLPLIQIACEYGLALLILSGFYWQRLRWVVLVLFAGFASYSFYLVTGGVSSCGCFGPVTVSPWWTLLLDTAIVLGLLWQVSGRSQVSDKELSHKPSASRLIIAGFVFAVSVIGFIAALQSTHGQAQSGLIAQAGGLVILEPDDWIGQELPIASYIDVDLSHGRWTVLLHRHDCPQCQQELPKYEQLAYEEQVALIDVPPFDDSRRQSGGAAVYASLSSELEWFVPTPFEIILIDGVVVSVSKHE
jgi:hypothetical protein